MLSILLLPLALCPSLLRPDIPQPRVERRSPNPYLLVSTPTDSTLFIALSTLSLPLYELVGS